MDLFTGSDSKSLFDIISKGSRTSEKRVMVEIYATRQAHATKKISNIGFVPSEHNLADGKTRPKMHRSILDLLKTGKHEVQCEQWIIH